MRTLSSAIEHEACKPPGFEAHETRFIRTKDMCGCGGGGEGGRGDRASLLEGQGPNLVGHLVAHGGIIAMHLIVALHDLNQKLQLDNDEFGGQS